MVLRGTDWSQFLSEFAEKVRQGKYKKTDYDTWRSLVREPRVEIIGKYSEKGYQYEVKGMGFTASFSSVDDSFGSYISDKIVDYFETPYSLTATGPGEVNLSWGDYLTNIASTTDALYSSSSAVSNAFANTITTTYTLTDSINDLCKKFDETFKEYNCKPIEDEKENKTMFNFDFGKVNGNTIHMSTYGLAVKNADGNWVSYDSNTHSMMNVDIINFNAENFMYKMPVALSAVEVGDVVIHNRKPCFVTAVDGDGKNLMVVDVVSGEEKAILPTRSPFGFNFITRVVNLLGDFTGTANEANPFGNMWMLMMMDGNKDIKDVLLLMMLSGNGGFDTSNPMAMYAMMTMMDGKSNDNLLPLMFMMNGNK